MVNTEIRLMIFFADKGGEALYNQQEQDLELTVAQIIISLLQNSGLKKAWEISRPFRYDLTQMPYDYAVERKKVKSLSRVRLFATPWTVAYQAPPSIRFSRQEYWSWN